MDVKYCADCGARISATTAFCPQCGAKQDSQNHSVPSQHNMQNYGGPVQQYMQGYGMPASQKSKAPIIIAICSIVAILVIIGAVAVGLRNTSGRSSSSSGRGSSSSGEVSSSGSGSSSSGGGGSSSSGGGGSSSSGGGSYSSGGNTWNLSPGEASVTVTTSSGSVSTTQQEAVYGHSSGLYGYNENYFMLSVAFNNTDTITLIVDIFEDYCQQGLSLSSQDFNETTKMGVLTTSSNDLALYNTYEYPQMIGNGSFQLEEYSANSTVFYIKADVVYNSTVYTLEGYGCADRKETDPLVLTSGDQWANEVQNGICPTCHGSGTCQVCFGWGSISGETCHGCWGSRLCEYCGGTGRTY